MVSVCDSGVEGDSLSSSTLSNTLIGQSVASNGDDQAISETLSDTSDDQTTTLGDISKSSFKMPTLDARRRSITVSKVSAETPALRESVISSRIANRQSVNGDGGGKNVSSTCTSRSTSNSSVNTRNSSQKIVTSRVSSKVAPDSSRIPSKVATIMSRYPVNGQTRGKSTTTVSSDLKSRSKVQPLPTVEMKMKKPPVPSSRVAPVQVASVKRSTCPPAPNRAVASRTALIQPNKASNQRPSDLPLNTRNTVRSALSSKNTPSVLSPSVSTPLTVASIPLKSSSATSVSSQNSRKSSSTVSSFAKSTNKASNCVVNSTQTNCKSSSIPPKKSLCANVISNAVTCDSKIVSNAPTPSLVKHSLIVNRLKGNAKTPSVTSSTTVTTRQGSALLKAQKNQETSKKLIESYKKSLDSQRVKLTHSYTVIDALAITVRYLNENLRAFETPSLRAQLQMTLHHLSQVEQSVASKNDELNNLKEQTSSREKCLHEEIENLKDEIEREKIRHSEEREMMLQQYSRGESAHKKYRINLERDWERKTKSLTDRIKTLECEVSSLQSVLELKQDKIKANEIRILELESACEELPCTKSSIVALRQKMEEIESIVANKNQQIKALLEENRRLEAINEKSVKEKKRLSLRNEELEFVLNESRSGNSSTVE